MKLPLICVIWMGRKSVIRRLLQGKPGPFCERLVGGVFSDHLSRRTQTVLETLLIGLGQRRADFLAHPAGRPRQTEGPFRLRLRGREAREDLQRIGDTLASSEAPTDRQTLLHERPRGDMVAHRPGNRSEVTQRIGGAIQVP